MVQESTQNLRIIGIGVCGPGEADRYMRKTMEEFKRLCDDVLIVTCNATQKEKDLIKEYGFNQYEDNREWGKEQPNIKTELLIKARELSPTWIVALDMDECFAREVSREILETLAKSGEIAWYFMIVNFYNDEQHFAHDKGIQRFWNMRFYKYLPELGLQFQKKALHCGLGPPYTYAYGWHAPYYVLHYGLMTKEDRLKKAQRYDRYDPKAQFKGRAYYDDLRRELEPRVFYPEALMRNLRNSADCAKRIPPKIK